MIGTDELRRRALVLRADAGAAVAAGVVERADRALAIAGDDDRIVADLDGEIVAGPRDFAIVADEQPIPIPDVFQVLPVIVGVDVEGPIEAVAVTPALQLAKHIGLGIHVLSSCAMFRRGRTGTRTGAHPCVLGSDPAARRNPLRLCLSRLVSGLRSRPSKDQPGAFPDGKPSSGLLPRLSLHHRCGGSAGI
ncbi:hypothetical protein D9M68_408670 [compost metagenome]